MTNNGGMMQTLRLLALQFSKVILAAFLVLVVILQCRDFKSATEVFPVASFAVLLTLGSFAISWCRIPAPLATASERKRTKRAGLDLFIATALTLVSAGLLRCAQDPLLKDNPIVWWVIIFHLLSLSAALLIGWISLVTLLNQAVNPVPDPVVDP